MSVYAHYSRCVGTANCNCYIVLNCTYMSVCQWATILNF